MANTQARGKRAQELHNLREERDDLRNRNSAYESLVKSLDQTLYAARDTADRLKVQLSRTSETLRQNVLWRKKLADALPGVRTAIWIWAKIFRNKDARFLLNAIDKQSFVVPPGYPKGDA